jgi:DNA polymerase-1
MEQPGPPRLFLIDGYALIYRAFFALMSRPLTTSHGENTSAAWGVVNFIQRLRAMHQPDYLGWVHDSGRSFRNDVYPAYKATRQKLSEDLQADFNRGLERIGQLLDAYRIPVLSLEGFEADDVIGTLADQGVTLGVNVVIVSGDKDFQQLVRPGIWLLNPGRGGAASVEEQWVSVANAAERLGVPPARVTDYLAMVGDSSDNVPGVPGIGEKTARDLVQEFGAIEDIVRAAPSLAKKRPREALLQYSQQAFLSKELVTIRHDLPIQLDLERLRVSPPDTARLRSLMVELEFHSLAKTLESPEPVREEHGARQERVARYVLVNTIADVERVVAQARAVGTITVHAACVSEPQSPLKTDPLRSTVVGLALALTPDEAYYLPLRHRGADQGIPDLLGATQAATPNAAAAPANLPSLDAPDMRPLRDLLEDGAVTKTAHHAKFDILALRLAGISIAGVEFDTMLASYVLDPGRRAHSLDVLALELLDATLMSYEDVCGRGKSAIPFDACPVEAARDYCCERANTALQLRRLFEPQLREHGVDPLLRDVEIPLITVLADMEWAGISIDLTWFHMLKERFQREREAVEREIYRAAGVEFNINSNPQLREILFTRLHLPVLKRTATGPSTDATVLEQLRDEGHELPQLLLEYRELSKLENTYLDALPALVNPRTRRLHTSFNQTVASTGRLSSSDPNLQNIPIRRELGRDIRRGFVPQTGWLLLAADYSQIELRLLAHLSGDPAFVDAFKAGGDIHRQTASTIFGVPVDAVTPEMRARAKTINFATIYGQGAHALSRQLKIEFAEARDFITTYFERFRGIREYLDAMVAFARAHGYVQTLFGRRRYIPELRDHNFNIRAFGERTAANSPIQGSAADLIKIAMIHIHSELRGRALQSRMLLQVHDELVFEVVPHELDAVRDLVRERMEHAATLSVPLVVDVGVGKNWLETKGS